APLGEDSVLVTKSNQIPDDEEVAGEVQFSDQRELVLELGADLGAEALPVSPPGALPGELLEERLLALSGRRRVVGELVGQGLEGEGAALGDPPRRLHGV